MYMSIYSKTYFCMLCVYFKILPESRGVELVACTSSNVHFVDNVFQNDGIEVLNKLEG